MQQQFHQQKCGGVVNRRSYPEQYGCITDSAVPASMSLSSNTFFTRPALSLQAANTVSGQQGTVLQSHSLQRQQQQQRQHHERQQQQGLLGSENVMGLMQLSQYSRGFSQQQRSSSSGSNSMVAAALQVAGPDSGNRPSVPAQVPVRCGTARGVFEVSRGRISCQCSGCVAAAGPAGVEMMPTEFERHGGCASFKKWKKSVLVEGIGKNIGSWLTQHGITIMSASAKTRQLKQQQQQFQKKQKLAAAFPAFVAVGGDCSLLRPSLGRLGAAGVHPAGTATSSGDNPAAAVHRMQQRRQAAVQYNKPQQVAHWPQGSSQPAPININEEHQLSWQDNIQQRLALLQETLQQPQQQQQQQQGDQFVTQQPCHCCPADDLSGIPYGSNHSNIEAVEAAEAGVGAATDMQLPTAVTASPAAGVMPAYGHEVPAAIWPQQFMGISSSSGWPRRGGFDLVGQKVKVWWPLDKDWYTATIEGFHPDLHLHTLRYEDGDVERLNLAEEQWELLQPASPETPPSIMANAAVTDKVITPLATMPAAAIAAATITPGVAGVTNETLDYPTAFGAAASPPLTAAAAEMLAKQCQPAASPRIEVTASTSRPAVKDHSGDEAGDAYSAYAASQSQLLPQIVAGTQALGLVADDAPIEVSNTCCGSSFSQTALTYGLQTQLAACPARPSGAGDAAHLQNWLGAAEHSVAERPLRVVWLEQEQRFRVLLAAELLAAGIEQYVMQEQEQELWWQQQEQEQQQAAKEQQEWQQQQQLLQPRHSYDAMGGSVKADGNAEHDSAATQCTSSAAAAAAAAATASMNTTSSEGMHPHALHYRAAATGTETASFHTGPAELLPVICGNRSGAFLVACKDVICQCADCQHEQKRTGLPVRMTAAEFERHGGLGSSRKWKSSIKVLLQDGVCMNIGRWMKLQQQQPMQTDTAVKYVVRDQAPCSVSAATATGQAGDNMLSPTTSITASTHLLDHAQQHICSNICHHTELQGPSRVENTAPTYRGLKRKYSQLQQRLCASPQMQHVHSILGKSEEHSVSEYHQLAGAKLVQQQQQQQRRSGSNDPITEREVAAVDMQIGPSNLSYQVSCMQDPTGYEVLCHMPGYSIDRIMLKAWDEGILLVRIAPSSSSSNHLHTAAGVRSRAAATPEVDDTAGGSAEQMQTGMIRLPGPVDASSAQAHMTDAGWLCVRIQCC